MSLDEYNGKSYDPEMIQSERVILKIRPRSVHTMG